MANPKSKAVAKAIAKTIEAGGMRLTFTLNPEEAVRWRRIAQRYDGQKETLMAAAAALEARKAPSPEEALAVIAAVVKGRARK